MDIRGYLPTSLIEWPGKISAVVFVGGCNFRCPFCYNRDLVLNPEKLAKIFPEEIFRDLKKRKKWVDGVVVTGGEPTLQTDLANFLRKIKELSFLTMIETNGTRPKIIAQLLNGQMVDRITMDIKTSLEQYPQATQPQIESSIQLIMNSGIDFEFRTTVVPTLHRQENLVKLAKQLKNKIENFPWFLQQFLPQNCLDPKFAKIKPYSKKEMREILAAVQKYLPSAKMRGV